jgi:predicted RNA-binding Zn-ribbon protein involved in translation (DUF1610 family)
MLDPWYLLRMTNWKCNECSWTGYREGVDRHIRASRHGCSPVREMAPCPACGESIVKGSAWCRHCRTQIVAINLPLRSN